MHEQYSPGTMKHTFRLDPETTVNGLLQDTEVVPGRPGYKLTTLEAASNGKRVDASTIMNVPFFDIPTIEWNLVLAYRGRELDLLDMTSISLGARDRWFKLGDKTVRELIASGHITSRAQVDAMPDERLEVLPNGELRMFTTVVGRTIEMNIPRSEWCWN